MQKKNVTICACSSRTLIDTQKVAAIADTLIKAHYQVTIEPDLCRKVMLASPDLAKVASTMILACYPRAIQSLFDSVNLYPKNMLDIRNTSSPDILKQLQINTDLNPENNPEQESVYKGVTALPGENQNDAWFPVIDKERCSECGKCFDFCLFGVYEIVHGLVKVAHPQNCKNNCPACARICPSKAIIFPKYEKSPINGGLEDQEFAFNLDTKTIYAEALKKRLEERRASVALLKKQKS